MWLNLHFKIVLLGGLEGEASLTVLPEVVAAAVVLTKRLDCYTALPKCLSRVPFPTGHRRHNSISTHPPTATSTLLAGVGQAPTRWIPLNYKGPSTAPLRPTRLRPPCFQARRSVLFRSIAAPASVEAVHGPRHPHAGGAPRVLHRGRAAR